MGATMAAVKNTSDSVTDPAEQPVSVAELLQPLVRALLGDVNVRIKFWDGSSSGEASSIGAILLRSPQALQRIIWAPDELGVGRAFVTGEIDFEGDIFELIKTLRPTQRALRRTLWELPSVVIAARKLNILHLPPSPPKEEARVHFWQHSKDHDAQSISHHYDIGNEFYKLVLGPSLTYSCARFSRPDMTLTEAQTSKHELVCRKLGLHNRPGQRLLDVGCGWGSMAIHAAQQHQAQVVGITISQEQADLAQQRVAEAGLSELVDIRLQDYRDISGETFDAVSSIGMIEHVGKTQMAKYLSILYGVLKPQGRLLNHAISSVEGSKLARRSFAYRYVFPDGELIDVGDVVQAMQTAGFEVRDVESLREHYAHTLRHWVSNLEEHQEKAISLVGEARVRVWHLFMAASSVGFSDGGLSVHQVLGVKTDPDGSSGMPSTRDGWSTATSKLTTSHHDISGTEPQLL